MNRIGIDVGGTKIEGILLDETYTIIEKKRIPTIQEAGYESILKFVITLIKYLENKSKIPASIGIGIPGSISTITKKVKNSNIKCFNGNRIKDDIEKLLGKQILLDNDANCFALAEAKLGVAKNYDFVFGVIMGTGVGGGIIINKKIHRGRNFIAGEWAHHMIQNYGKKCLCGKNDCVNAFLSGPSLEKRWFELTQEKLSLEQIVPNLSLSKALQWKNEFIENFGISVSNIINFLDPDVIVLGGGVSNIPILYDEGKDAVCKYVYSDYIDTPILKNQLGDSGGVYGAAMLNDST